MLGTGRRVKKGPNVNVLISLIGSHQVRNEPDKIALLYRNLIRKLPEKWNPGNPVTQSECQCVKSQYWKNQSETLCRKNMASVDCQRATDTN